MNDFSRKAIRTTVVLLLSGFLSAQQTGEIRGQITDDRGEALPGVAVTATSPSLQGLRTAVSEQEGIFRLSLLPVGTYAIVFELPGFEKLTLFDQRVRLGFTVDIPVTLKSARISAEVTVRAPAPLIDKTKIDTSYRLNSDDLSRIPTQAKTITEVVGLAPGVTGVRMNTITGGSNFGPTPHAGYSGETGLASFRGEGDMGNNWMIDGLSSKGAAANIPAIGVNYDAWEEVQIISDGFAPDLGQGLGGFINIVTKSGGNDVNGEVGALLRSHGLRASRLEQLSAPTVPTTSLSQFFGNLGGPIVKDKLWFFFSDNYFRNIDRTTEQTVDWLTIPGGDRRIATNNIFGKITWTPFQNHTFALSGTSDNFLSQTGGVGVPETYSKWTNNIQYYRASYQGILSSDTLLTVAGGYNRRINKGRPLDGDYGPPPYYWQDIALATNNAEFSWSALDRRTDLSASVIRFFELRGWGRHELRIGAGYYDNLYDVDWPNTGRDLDPWPGNGFDDGAEVFWMSPGIPMMFYEKAAFHPRNSSRGLTFHIQDSLTLGRLSLMLGLRSDTQRVYGGLGEPGWAWGFGDFLQPRASLAFDITGNGKNILKFAYGRFSLPIACLDLQGMFNEVTPLRIYGWEGPQDPTEVQLGDPSNWVFFFEQSPTSTPRTLDPALNPNKMDKFHLEFDRQLGRYWAIKVRGIYSYSKNLIEDIGIYDPEVPSAVRFQFVNFELKRRNYRAFEVELDGRIAERFMLHASYTLSAAKGTNTGNNFELYQWDLGWGDLYGWSFFGDHPLVPEGAPEKESIDASYHGLGGRGIGDEGWYGKLPYSVDDIVKVLGTYLAPYGIAASTNIEYLSGYHWERKGWSDGFGLFALFPEGRGGRETPPHLYVDLAVEKEFHIRKGAALVAGLNVYNLFNSQRPVSYAKQDNELFGQVWARQLPRWVQIKFSLKF